MEGDGEEYRSNSLCQLPWTVQKGAISHCIYTFYHTDAPVMYNYTCDADDRLTHMFEGALKRILSYKAS